MTKSRLELHGLRWLVVMQSARTAADPAGFLTPHACGKSGNVISAPCFAVQLIPRDDLHWKVTVAGPKNGLFKECEPAGREHRDLARRARRLVSMVADPHDQARITRYADELEQRAAELKAEAASKQAAVNQPSL